MDKTENQLEAILSLAVIVFLYYAFNILGIFIGVLLILSWAYAKSKSEGINQTIYYFFAWFFSIIVIGFFGLLLLSIL